MLDSDGNMVNDEGKPVESGKYDEPQERLTRLAGVAAEALQADPEFGDDIQGAFMLHDQEGGSGSCLLGYPDGQETDFKSLADVVQHIKLLFRSGGIDMELEMVTREDPDVLLDGPEVPAEEAAGSPKVVLTLTADAPDPRMAELCRTVKEAVEATSGLAETRMILIMDLGGNTGAIMHHGYEGQHHMAHGLFSAFQRVVSAEGGQVMVIPILDQGTLN